MSNNFNYNDFINEAKQASVKSSDFSTSPFTIGDVKKDNSLDFTKMDSPKDISHSYVDENYYKQNKAYNNLTNKMSKYNFDKTFNNAMSKDVGNIESSKAINATMKNSKGSVNALVPEVLSKVSDNVENTIDSITNYFQDKLDSISMQDINNYAKISDALNQRAGLDSQLESDLLKAWSINKEMQYSLEGLGIEEDALAQQQKYQKIQVAVSTVATIVGAIALFI